MGHKSQNVNPHRHSESFRGNRNPCIEFCNFKRCREITVLSLKKYHSFVCPSVHLFVQFICLFLHLFVHLFVYSNIILFICLFARLFVHALVYPNTWSFVVRMFVHLFVIMVVHLFVRLFVYSFICLFNVCSSILSYICPFI